MGLARFMATTAGRSTRIVAGLILIAIGFWVVGGTAGWVIAIVGLVPIAAGAFNVCLSAPFTGAPFRGRDLQ